MIADSFGRQLDYLRISITDRCNLDCLYCSRGKIIPREEILTFEEIESIIGVFHELGIKKVRFTGGEPLLRRGFDLLIERIREKFPDIQLGITTNGVMLSDKAEFLKENDVSCNVSFDTLSPEKFYAITGTYTFHKVLEGIEKAISLGLKVKLNTVPLKSINLDEIIPLIEFAGEMKLEIRFIELMPIMMRPDFWKTEFVPVSTVKEIIRKNKLKMEHIQKEKIADIFSVEGVRVGFISTVSSPFCNLCSRIRITSDGRVVLCLFDKFSYSIKSFLRPKLKKDELKEFLVQVATKKPRGFIELKDKIFDSAFPMRTLGG